MNTEAIERVVQAVLYEGYALYPYRPSIKNSHRWTFGGVYPPTWNAKHPDDRSFMQMQCIVLPTAETKLSVSLRFLQPQQEGEWQQGRERKVDCERLLIDDLRTKEHRFHIDPIHGVIGIAATKQGDSVLLTVRVENQTPISEAVLSDRDQTMLHSLASTHILLTIESGQFVSLTDPPAEHREQAQKCENIGCWPVLVGAPGEKYAMLASPIILPDHPQIAAQSPGDLFDGTEIDEILTLRILTLTDEEKRQVASTDERVRQLLNRTENIARQQLMNLHGTWRQPQSSTFKPGDQVILHPRKRADILDVAFEGRRATITAVEHDFENKTHLAVTVDDDPGKDLGVFGHRFFFSPEELERVSPAEVAS